MNCGVCTYVCLCVFYIVYGAGVRKSFASILHGLGFSFIHFFIKLFDLVGSLQLNIIIISASQTFYSLVFFLE